MPLRRLAWLTGLLKPQLANSQYCQCFTSDQSDRGLKLERFCRLVLQGYVNLPSVIFNGRLVRRGSGWDRWFAFVDLIVAAAKSTEQRKNVDL